MGDRACHAARMLCVLRLLGSFCMLCSRAGWAQEFGTWGLGLPTAPADNRVIITFLFCCFDDEVGPEPRKLHRSLTFVSLGGQGGGASHWSRFQLTSFHEQQCDSAG